MERYQKKVAAAGSKRAQILAHQPNGHVVVQGLLFWTHRVLEQTCSTFHKRYFQEFLRLTAKGTLEDGLQPASQLRNLCCKRHSVVAVGEHLSKSGEPSQ